ncbi:MAG TPA: ATP-binding protein, partial [Jatrophihabitantaceae bacterium]|nr:ATP-binding protein [Jatrophihabitantaceae bacterium]
NVRFDGPIDAVVQEAIVEELSAVLREILTNIARHAHARHTEIILSASAALLSLQVIDDGVGLGTTTRRSGLANLARRAEQYNGTLVLEPAPPGFATSTGEGTSVLWTIPLS